MTETKLSTELRIGRIQYVNTLPFYEGLVQQGDLWDVKQSYPAELNRWMQEGALDVAPISSLEYANHPNHYYLLPDLCIGAKNFSGSVLLFSKEKLENLNGKKIALSQESFSSQALLKVLLRQRFDFRNEFLVMPGNPREMLRQAVACLVIGDNALFYQSDTFFYKYDLSELWFEWTGKPFCFSVWAVRRDFFSENPSAVTTFHERLKQNTKRNLEQLEVLIHKALHFPIHHERFAQVFSYLSHLSYDLTDEMKDGLTHFFKFAQESGLVAQVPELQWASEK